MSGSNCSFTTQTLISTELPFSRRVYFVHLVFIESVTIWFQEIHSSKLITARERTAIRKSQLEPVIVKPGNTRGTEQGFGRWFADVLYRDLVRLRSTHAILISGECAFCLNNRKIIDKTYRKVPLLHQSPTESSPKLHRVMVWKYYKIKHKLRENNPEKPFSVAYVQLKSCAQAISGLCGSSVIQIILKISPVTR